MEIEFVSKFEIDIYRSCVKNGKIGLPPFVFHESKQRIRIKRIAGKQSSIFSACCKTVSALIAAFMLFILLL